jgi:hypothetical protein
MLLLYRFLASDVGSAFVTFADRHDFMEEVRGGEVPGRSAFDHLAVFADGVEDGENRKVKVFVDAVESLVPAEEAGSLAAFKAENDLVSDFELFVEELLCGHVGFIMKLSGNTAVL